MTVSSLERPCLRSPLPSLDGPRYPPLSAGKPGLDVVFRPDPHIHDGQFANNGWSQELPKPHTRLTWDNAALISPATAERLGLSNEEVVELQYEGRKVGGTRLDSAGTAERLGHFASWLWPCSDRACWQRCRVQHLCHSTAGAPWFGFGIATEQDGTSLPAGMHAASPQHGRA